MPNIKFWLKVGIYSALIATMLLFAGNMLRQNTTSVSAQEQDNNLEQILIDLNQRIADGTGFTFTIGFINPIYEEERFWIIGDETSTPRRYIHSIGSDNVCFAEDRGGALFIRCIPYHNILDVSYIE
jgi:hypothetical protein